MKFHEYQTKQLFRDYGIPVPKGIAVKEKSELSTAFDKLGKNPVVVKAQVLMGGRGKAGGIQFADNLDELNSKASDLLGKELKTYQSGDHGEVIRTLYIEEKSNIAKSFYLAMVVDRDNQKVNLIGSAEGGVEIEDVAANHPDKIHTLPISPTGYSSYVGRETARRLGLEATLFNAFASLTGKLYHMFVEKDASMLEINPLVLTVDNQLIALDAKFVLDESASYRQKTLSEIYQGENAQAEDQQEQEAGRIGVNYVSLDGSIGCMVNGAGLAMATMDLIKLFGGSPANFLDVGGSVSTEQVSEAFKLLTSHEKVKGILVNIFGGIVHCDKVATGIVCATKELDLKVPVVVRLEGTNVDQGKKILEDSGLDLTAADGMEDAAKKIVEKVA